MTKKGMTADSLVPFLSEYCETDWRSELSSDLLRKVYREFCKTEGQTPIDDSELDRRLSSLGYVRTRRNAVWAWGGVKLIHEEAHASSDTIQLSSLAS